MQSTSANIIVGSQVWVEDNEVSWIDGEVLEINDKKIKVQCSSGKEVSFSFIEFMFLDLGNDTIWVWIKIFKIPNLTNLL